ncbi:uncharacterized protein N7515_010211 [Penicillium bovifimosum]|uniref:Uncharacterized protein n=1 Tax=Penicillium bovifimosum TaxID=126998 RepID=A0A9W9GI39_9EURO|nr:uncharacterized protein N7515_010211 [Penicillium bovifimosum]KAJ5120823.1 hypothetical protein N7515_010211 [Penicillium bovifimosum]
MMILGWSGIRLQRVVNDDNSCFFDKERKKALAVLRSHGLVHNNSGWRNTLWDELSGFMVIIDLEDVKWLKRPRALEPISGNTRRVYRAAAAESRNRLLCSSTAVCT